MGDSRSAAAIDRLPWLEDEPQSLRGQSRPGLWLWAAPALVLVAAASYWLGSRSYEDDSLSQPAASVPRAKAPAATLTLPQPRASGIEVPVAAETPEAAASSAHPIRVRQGRAVARSATPAPAGPAPGLKSKPAGPTYWPALTSAGASGRMVRIGAFGSRAQAKKGWRRVVSVYPGMRRIPAAVVPVQSLRDGQTYYRLQMGTTSQAHSEVLCQRMRIIGQSCIVVGLKGARS